MSKNFPLDRMPYLWPNREPPDWPKEGLEPNAELAAP